MGAIFNSIIIFFFFTLPLNNDSKTFVTSVLLSLSLQRGNWLRCCWALWVRTATGPRWAPRPQPGSTERGPPPPKTPSTPQLNLRSVTALTGLNAFFHSALLNPPSLSELRVIVSHSSVFKKLMPPLDLDLWGTEQVHQGLSCPFSAFVVTVLSVPLSLST